MLVMLVVSDWLLFLTICRHVTSRLWLHVSCQLGILSPPRYSWKTEIYSLVHWSLCISCDTGSIWLDLHFDDLSCSLCDRRLYSCCSTVQCVINLCKLYVLITQLLSLTCYTPSHSDRLSEYADITFVMYLYRLALWCSCQPSEHQAPSTEHQAPIAEHQAPGTSLVWCWGHDGVTCAPGAPANGRAPDARL